MEGSSRRKLGDGPEPAAHGRQDVSAYAAIRCCLLNRFTQNSWHTLSIYTIKFILCLIRAIFLYLFSRNKYWIFCCIVLSTFFILVVLKYFIYSYNRQHSVPPINFSFRKNNCRLVSNWMVIHNFHNRSRHLFYLKYYRNLMLQNYSYLHCIVM